MGLSDALCAKLDTELLPAGSQGPSTSHSDLGTPFLQQLEHPGPSLGVTVWPRMIKA